MASAISLDFAQGVVAGPRIRVPAELPPGLEWFDASHPFPNTASEAAGRRALAIAAQCGARGSLLVLLSGGASSMLAVPAPTLTLADKGVTSRALMNAGAPIADLNCVRKHLSAVKGGRLAAAAGRTTTLALSDVHGPVADDPFSDWIRTDSGGSDDARGGAGDCPPRWGCGDDPRACVGVSRAWG